jgi:chromosome partitioning protein
MRLSHALADTLVTPVNDSFIDLDVLGRVEGPDYAITGISQYAALVEEVRRKRQQSVPNGADWVVVRNRLSTLSSRNQRHVIAGLDALSGRLGFRIAHGVSERVIFREFFPVGLTAFDPLQRAVLRTRPTMSHLTARNEIRELIDCLHLPLKAPATAPVDMADAPPALPSGLTVPVVQPAL